ncbi:MAG: tRNA pseudouridine(13) synthase TruD, partial [Myxococcales bacterium]|nr:tRNA pseudouridine(13) synthase TruD [Myxococcales bacterium]
NRFTIVLRDLDPARTPEILAALDEVKVQGVPNAFGGQRFGREGDNADRGRKMLLGEIRPPRNKKQQRFLFSAFQSRMFNEVLAAREADGSWCRILPGDVAQKHDSGGLFTVPLEGPELDDAVARSRAGQISPTGPMFGSKMRRAEGPVGELEAGVLAAALPDPSVLDAHQRLGRGTRRPLRIWVDELSYDLDDAARCLTVRFVLPKGAYATTVLSKTCELHDQSRNAVEPGGGQW